MRITSKLYAQHLGWTFKKHWEVQGKRVARDTGATAELQKFGITVKDVKDVLSTKKEDQRLYLFESNQRKVAYDESHPNWHLNESHIYDDRNVLLEGVRQAQLLTKTVEINEFPKNITDAIGNLQIPTLIDRNVQNSIMATHVFDAEQVKLPKVKLPDRPAYNLPRDYGVSHSRRNRLLINRLIMECEKLAGRTVSLHRKLMDNAGFSVTLSRDNDLLQFSVNVEKMISSMRPLGAVKGQFVDKLPDLFPIKCTVAIPKRHIYTTETVYPLSKNLHCSYPHTIFLHFNKELVGNLHETWVTDTQFESRTLMKAFAVAAARAKSIYGDIPLDVLPKPIVVQSVQTDGRSFHFGILQLNTLAVGSSGELKNYFFHHPSMKLFKECGYRGGMPFLEGYNKDVFRHICAFYNNS